MKNVLIALIAVPLSIVAFLYCFVEGWYLWIDMWDWLIPRHYTEYAHIETMGSFLTVMFIKFLSYPFMIGGTISTLAEVLKEEKPKE